MQPEERFDFMVVGAGVAGLMVASSLARLGAEVIVVEAGASAAPGPSTRNGGFVHAGAFHAGVIDDPVRARITSARCRQGAQRLSAEFPEAVQADGLPVFMVSENEVVIERVRRRWPDWGIAHRTVTPRELMTLVPGISVHSDAFVAETNDFAFNWRIALQIMLVQSRRNGCRVLFDHRLVSSDGEHHQLESGGTPRAIRASNTILCTGYQSAFAVRELSTRWDVRPQVRLWRSHVLVAPRLAQPGVMYIDPGGLSVMPQGHYSVICQSQEDTPVETPAFAVDNEVVERIRSGASRLLPASTTELRTARAHACLKPMIAVDGENHRRVDSQIVQVAETTWIALPGKATEAPLLADDLVRALPVRSVAPDVTPRPGDLYTWNVEAESANQVESERVTVS
ncbi:FAD-binding oxidoreductase [Yimella sp. cx-573]|nr:FAD-binding oxidoreductase [Yimella sp. cx-573]